MSRVAKGTLVDSEVIDLGHGEPVTCLECLDNMVLYRHLIDACVWPGAVR